MTATNFQNCLSVTLKWEGGWADNPKDPGGATMKGITLATFRRWRPQATKADLKAISDDVLSTIYRTDYWNPVTGDAQPDGVDLAAFDYAVNSGPSRALSVLKACNGLSPKDGVKKICATRTGFLRGLKTFVTFGRGWLNRVADIEAKATKMCLTVAAAATVSATVTDKTSVADKMTGEAVAAQKTAKRQSDGATATATAGGTGGVFSLSDQAAHWITIGIVVAAVGVIAYLVWRSSVNKARADAFAAEAVA